MSRFKVSKKNVAKPGKLGDQNPLNLVVFTIDPNLDNLESRNVFSNKTITARKIFSNYHKANQL